MKRWLYLLLVSVLAQAVQAQPNSRYAGPPDKVGANYRVWYGDAGGGMRKNISPQMDAYAPDMSVENAGGGVVEIGSGLNYWDGTQWLPSNPSFASTTDGFEASRVQHRVYLYRDLNGVNSVNITLPDGLQLKSTPVALALSDPTSGQMLVIAQLTNTVGTLISSNQVWYRDAFQGGVNADIVYTVNRGGFDQDVVLTSRLDPADYGFPTNSRLQILTEFYDAPTPTRTRRPLYVEQNEKVRKQKVSPDLIDEVLGFHSLFMGTGRVFTVPNQDHPTGMEALVAKQFVTVDGRTFLIETVDNEGIRETLRQLPAIEGNASTVAMLRQTGTKRRGFESVPRPLQIARSPLPTGAQSGTQLAFSQRPIRPEVVVDYTTVVGSSYPTVFRGDTTYKVSSTAYFYGTVTFDGGTVIKYTADTSIVLSGTVTCGSSSYRPAIFTAVDDNTVGESIGTGSISSSGYASPALTLSYLSAPVLSNIRVSHAKEAVRLVTSTSTSVSGTIEHSQFVDCILGVTLMDTGGSGSGSGSGSGGGITMTVKNALFSAVREPLFVGSGNGPAAAAFYSCTIAGASTAAFYSQRSYQLTVRNCVLANNTANFGGYSALLTASDNGFYGNQGSLSTFGSPAYTPANNQTPFQTVGYGGYYLTDGSQFQNRGSTANLPPGLVDGLQKRTTAPPPPAARLAGGTISTPANWVPVTPRDDDGTLDLGYHYDPLDYTVNGVTLATTLNLASGVVVGLTGDYGLYVLSGGNISSVGKPSSLNRFCFYGNVQENTVSMSGGGRQPVMKVNGTYNNNLDFHFTDFALAPGYTNEIVLALEANQLSGTISFRDCQLRGGCFALGPIGTTTAFTINFNNNLIEYFGINLNRLAQVTLTANFYNNLFRSSLLKVTYTASASNPTWNVKDNLFYWTPQTWSAPAANVLVSNNGFTTGTVNTMGGGGIGGLTPDFQSGPLGNYYYPDFHLYPLDLYSLVDQGSRLSSDAGLDGYATQVSQDTDSGTVDIGYHLMRAPVASDDPSEVTCPEDTHPIELSNYATDLSGLPLSYHIVSPPQHGTLASGQQLGEFIYQATSYNEASDSFTFKVNNGYADSAVKTVTIALGYNPVADGQTRVTDLKRPINVTLTASEQCSHNPFTFSIARYPTLGILSGTTPNITYTPRAVGVDTFTFKASDGRHASDAATISITVLPTLVLTASSRPASIILKWSLSDEYRNFVNDFVIYRSTTSGGPYSPIGTASVNEREFGDGNVVPGQIYYYVVSFHYSDPGATTTDLYEDVSAEISCSTACPPSGQFWTDQGYPAQQLAEWLTAPGVTVGNASFTGAAVAKGIFAGGGSVGFPIERGVILSSGDIVIAAGPNDQGAAGKENGLSGDSDLSALLGTVTGDAAVLEYNLVPPGSSGQHYQLQFEFVFGSEEYEEYIGQYNDAFAIFVDGQNIAWVPGTTNSPIGVGTINNESHSDYYTHNEDPVVFDLQFDGFTTSANHPVLTATASITAGVSHHIKLVIGDAIDHRLDSAVFIRAKRPITICP